MSTTTTINATGFCYANNGNWASSKTKNPLYIGTNSSGSYEYIGQLIFPKISVSSGFTVEKMELSIYRNSNNATYTRTQYYGCSADQTDYGSVLSTGATVNITGGEGWKTLNVSTLISEAAPFAGEWAFLIGNPNTKNTYCVIDGYNSGHTPYLTVTMSNGSKVYYASSGVAKRACKVYHAWDKDYLELCNVYYATSDKTLVRI